MLVDAHCHLNSLPPAELAFLSEAAGEYVFIDASVDLDSFNKSLALSGNFPFIRSCAGFHPFSINSGYNDRTIEEYEDIFNREGDPVAIGEVGLDCKALKDVEYQTEVLIRFIRLARDRGLPLVIHNRMDSDRILSVLDGYFDDYSNIVFHCFSQGPELLEKVVDKKGYVSFSLNILRNNKLVTRSLKEVPLKNLLLETDSPYMRIKGNNSSPLDIVKVYEQAAGVKNIDFIELRDQVFSNAKELFGL